MKMNYSELNNNTHANIKWLKPQLQAAYAKWESAKNLDESTIAFNEWNELMAEELATGKQVKRCIAHHEMEAI